MIGKKILLLLSISILSTFIEAAGDNSVLRKSDSYSLIEQGSPQWDNEFEDCIEISCNMTPFKRRTQRFNSPLLYGSQPLGGSNNSSLNWSGYAAMKGSATVLKPTFNSVTDVSGSWTIPSLITNPSADTFSSAWVGIDGVRNDVVEQIGTEHDIINGEVIYFAWFEQFPASAQKIDGFPVKPGDKIHARVTYQGMNDCQNDVFLLRIVNETRNVKFQIKQATLPGNPSHRMSAEWIVEAPSSPNELIAPFIEAPLTVNCLDILPLANFETIYFSNCQAIIDGRQGPIDDKHWTFTRITMTTGPTDGNVIKAVPSVLTHTDCNGSSRKNKCKKNSFSVSWKNAGILPFQLFCK